MLKATSAMVYPLVFILLALSFYLIPDWNSSMVEVAPDWSTMPSIVWLAIPIIVFSFNHSQSSLSSLKSNVVCTVKMLFRKQMLSLAAQQ